MYDREIRASATKVTVTSEFTIAVGQPIDEQGWQKYRAMKNPPVEVLIEHHDESNDYHCPENSSTVFAKLDEKGNVAELSLRARCQPYTPWKS